MAKSRRKRRAFRIKPEYLEDVPVRKRMRIQYADGACFDTDTHSTGDHPEFTKFRERLAKLGFIRIVKVCYNSDEVLKNFSVNGVPFDKGDMFLCGVALGNAIRIYKAMSIRIS